MNVLLSFISQYINVFILLLGFIILGGITVLSIILMNQRNELTDMSKGTRVSTSVNPTTLEARHDHYTTVSREDLGIKRAAFNRHCSMYQLFTQLIPVLPLMGILGTVAGLITEVSAQDMEAIYGSLNTALMSTLIALIFAIINKIVDAASGSRMIFEIEVIFEDYDRRFRDALDMGHFEK